MKDRELDWVNFRTWVPMVKPYPSILKYPNYKKEANPDVHVRVFNGVVKTNGKNLKNTKSMHLVIH